MKEMIGGIYSTFNEKSQELTTIKQMIGYKEENNSTLY